MINSAAQTATINKTSLSSPLRIVQISPVYYPVRPSNYGGIERVIYKLTEQLV